MNRRHLAFLILVNAVVSLLIALLVNWAIEQRRPDLEELAALYTPEPRAIIAPTSVPDSAGELPATTAPAAQSTQAAVASAPVEAAGEGESYIVQAGDSLSTIAAKFDTTVNAIMVANKLDNPDVVFVGQPLRLPTNVTTTGPDEAGSTPTPAPTPEPDVGVQITAVANIGDLATENILIVNEGATPLNLQGWTIVSDSGSVYQFNDLPLFAGSSIRLHSGQGDDSSIDLYWGQSDPIWQTGTEVRLVNAQGTLAHQYTIP